MGLRPGENTHLHTNSFSQEQHTCAGYSKNSPGQSLMNPLKAASELKRPETSILITASLSIKLDAPVEAVASDVIRHEHDE